MTEAEESYYIVLHKKDGVPTGHAVTTNLELVHEPLSVAEKVPEEPAPLKEPTTFADVFASFQSAVTIYQNFLAFMIGLAPMASAILADSAISGFAKRKGVARDDFSTDDRTVFQMSMRTFREFMVLEQEVDAGIKGTSHIPEVMLVGLVSAYDAFLGKLLRVIFSTHEKLILTSEKSIRFSELSAFGSIEAARQALIDREIEAILRESHQEHFRWMEKRFEVTLTDLPAFRKFIELCERRNLLSHTGGVVSAQYIANCKEFGADVRAINVGDQLTVDPTYYRDAVNIVCEIGIKLCWVLWRRFVKDEREIADSALNEFCYELIVRRNYETAEAILSFSTKWAHSDRCRRMMIVNQANAIRLQKRQAEATKLLDGEDWSAVSDDFKISVAAIRGDVDEVVRLMKKNGAHGRPNAEDFRTWPIFRGIRTNPKFSGAFELVFGEPVNLPTPTKLNPSILVDKPGSTPTNSKLH
jgi:hypothetical protein